MGSNIEGSLVTIPLLKYENLVRAKAKLEALECAGVDNWEGYSDAMAGFYEDDE